MIVHVVALSGGKDSTAMAVLLKEREPRDYVYIYTPTGNELPPMQAHWKRLETMLETPITSLTNQSLGGLIETFGALPNWRQRWCTRMLKIEPYARFLSALIGECEGVVSYVGLRADESEREGGDYAKIQGVEMRYPLRDWDMDEADVWGALADRDIQIPIRTDCGLCFYQRLPEWYALWQDYPEQYQEGVDWENATEHTFRSPSRDTWPASLAELRTEFESGRVPRERRGDVALANLKCRVCRL